MQIKEKIVAIVETQKQRDFRLSYQINLRIKNIGKIC